MGRSVGRSPRYGMKEYKGLNIEYVNYNLLGEAYICKETHPIVRRQTAELPFPKQEVLC